MTKARSEPEPAAGLARFVEDFASVLADSGFPRMPARIFACLLVAERGRLTAPDLAERLRVSPAAVSGAVRYLALVNLVSRTREPGSRRDLYVLDHEVFYRAMASRDSDLARWVARLEDGIAVLGPDAEAAERLQEMRDFTVFMQAELAGMLRRWDELRRSVGRGRS